MARSASEKNSSTQGKGSTKDPFNFTETLRTFASMQSPIDREIWLQQHRKNIEALTAANTMAAEVMKSISQLQTSFIKQAFEEMTSYIRECSQNLKPADLNKKAEPLRKQVDLMTDHSKNVANMLAQSNRQIYDVFHQRFQQSVEDVKDAAKSSGRKKH